MGTKSRGSNAEESANRGSGCVKSVTGKVTHYFPSFYPSYFCHFLPHVRFLWETLVLYEGIKSTIYVRNYRPYVTGLSRTSSDAKLEHRETAATVDMTRKVGESDTTTAF